MPFYFGQLREVPGPVDPGYGHPGLPGYGGGYPSTGPVFPGGPVDPGYGRPELPPWSGNYPSTGPVRPGGPVDPGYGRPDVPALPPHIWGALLRLLGTVDPGYGRPEIPGFKPVDPGYGHPGGGGGNYPSTGPILPPWSGNYPSTGPVFPPLVFPEPPGGSTKPPPPASIIIYLPGHVPPFIAVPINPPVPGEPIELPEQPPVVDNTLPTAETKPA